jgi:dTDP-glucose 4,6-dehydratase
MNRLAGRKVLVTGAGGFIGSHLAECLVAAGAEVRALVHYNALGSRGWLDTSEQARHMEIVAGDIVDRDSVMHAVQGREIVFHLAALIAIPYSYHAPESHVRTNVLGTLNVLQAARACAVQRLIHTSTSEVYGTAQYVPIDEQHPLQGQSPYAASKIGADKLVESFYRSFGVPTVTVRPFNTFGPRQSARAVIPTIITQCLAGGQVRLGSLHPLRDLNFVQNTVDGFLAAAQMDGVEGQTFNLGSGREISIGDLAHLIASLAHVTLKLESDGQRLRPGKSEVERLLAANDKAVRKLEWHPRVLLEEGLIQTIAWIRENLSRYRVRDYSV